MAFLVIFGVGLFLAVVTFIVGEFFDLGAEGGSDFDGTSHSPFSSRILFVFATAFGGFGYIGQSLDWSIWAAVLFAAFGGFAVAGGTFFLIVMPMSRQQGSTHVAQSDFLGLQGQVSSEIPEGGVGRVSVVAPGSGARVAHAARSSSGERIAQGTPVRVMAVGPGSITVAPVGSESAPAPLEPASKGTEE